MENSNHGAREILERLYIAQKIDGMNKKTKMIGYVLLSAGITLGYGRLVVMDIEYYERTMQKMYEAKTISGLFMAGRTWTKYCGS